MKKKTIYMMMVLSIFPWMLSHAENKNSLNGQNLAEAKRFDNGQNYKVEKLALFQEPWALAELEDGRLLITERKGNLKLFNPLTKQITKIGLALPKLAYGGQGGLGDITLHPDFKRNHWIYLSYAESVQGGSGAVVVRGELDLSQPQPRVKKLIRIWEQVPKIDGQGHYSHRMLFDQDHKLWISSGERQQFTPAQDLNTNLGKIIRLNEDGTPAIGNPFATQGGIAKQIWSYGHRNPLGIAFDAKGTLWEVEMGPKGGDELNIIQKAKNYGYPIVSNGDHYDGKPIPDHDTHPELQAPEISWTPVISPSSLIIYHGASFPFWQNKALIGGLSSEAIIVVDIEQRPVQEVQRLELKKRIRDLHLSRNGTIWGLEDGENANLFRLIP